MSSATAEYVGYVSDPDGRGTPTLVISCLLTLLLCVWSALHLNVPRRGQKMWQLALQNASWIFAGIYAPELVVFTAWRQWSSSRLLQRAVMDRLAAKQEASEPSPWTMLHSFFACTGGFAFELNSMTAALPPDARDHDKTPEGRPVPRITITARGMALMAKLGHLPVISREEIEDKSKANDLAKATVIMQATWMIVQVFGRLAFRLTVTLLEVNTVAHVLCAFAMYLFWWNKPLLPNEPVIIRDDSLAPLAAFMYCSSELSGYVRPKGYKSQTWIKTLFAQLNLFSKSPEVEQICARFPSDKPTGPSHGQNTDDLPAHDAVEVPKTGIVIKAPKSCLDLLRDKQGKEKGTAFFERRPRVVDERPVTEASLKSEEARYELLLEALQLYPDFVNDRASMSHRVDGSLCVHLRPEPLVADHIQNWPANDLIRNVDGLVVGMILWFANFCYGGIHAAAWDGYFPSDVEKWMWRLSSAYIGFCGGLWVVLNFLVSRNSRLNAFWENWMDGKKTWWESVGLGIVVFVCGFSLVIARGFLVLEAFVSVRQLPVDAYTTPQWTTIFPHL